MDLAAQLIALLDRHPRVRLAVLFGSVAAGRATAESDIDLAVAADTPLSVAERMALIGDVAEATGRPVDLIDMQVADGLVLREALCGGRALIRHSPDLYAALMLRVMHDDADVRPYRERILAGRRQAWLAR